MRLGPSESACNALGMANAHQRFIVEILCLNSLELYNFPSSRPNLSSRLVIGIIFISLLCLALINQAPISGTRRIQSGFVMSALECTPPVRQKQLG